MRLIYAPEGAEPQSWDFEPRKIMSPEAELIERHTGWTFDEFGQQFLKGSTLARHALLYVMLKRKTPGLRFDDVQFAMGEVDVVFGDDEMRAFRAALEEKRDSVGLDEKEQAALDALLESLSPEEAAPFEKQDEEAPASGSDDPTS